MALPRGCGLIVPTPVGCPAPHPWDRLATAVALQLSLTPGEAVSDTPARPCWRDTKAPPAGALLSMTDLARQALEKWLSTV